MNEIKIESGIPIPRHPNRCGFAETFKNMKVGDSVLFDKLASFHSMAKQLGGKVVTRKEGAGWRVWRIT